MKRNHDGTCLKQIGAEMFKESVRKDYKQKTEVQCKGGVGADSMSSLIVAAGERRGWLRVGFENMKRSRVMK